MNIIIIYITLNAQTFSRNDLVKRFSIRRVDIYYRHLNANRTGDLKRMYAKRLAYAKLERDCRLQ